jgi:hypothetical protein
MEYKVPDINKLRLLEEYIIKEWDYPPLTLRFLQTLCPTRDFGSELPMKDNEHIVYHCLNGGDVFLALASRLDADWIASDIRPSCIEHVKQKIENPKVRLRDIAYAVSNTIDNGKSGLVKSKIRKHIYREAKILQKRKIRYLVGNSNYLSVPTNSVDWSFSYEPMFLREPTALIEMLASARRGAIISLSQKNIPSSDSLKKLESSDFSVFFNTALEYGLGVKTKHTTTNSFDEGEQEIGFAIIKSDSDLPALDREIMKYCAEYVFPNQKIPGKNPTYETNILPKGPFNMDITKAKKTLGFGKKEILESLKRINRIMEIKHCDLNYSYIKIKNAEAGI